MLKVNQTSYMSWFLVVMPKFSQYNFMSFEVHLAQPVTCHVSPAMCHMSHVTCHLSDATFFFFRQSGEASHWRVCYQWGYPV